MNNLQTEMFLKLTGRREKNKENETKTPYLRFCLAFTVCGSVVNNILKSPGYPSNYPNNMDCVYRIPIPYGVALNIYFQDFHLEYCSSSCM